MVLFDRMEHVYGTMHDDDDDSKDNKDDLKLFHDERFYCSVPAPDPKLIIGGTVEYVIGHEKTFMDLVVGLVDVLAAIVIRMIPSQALAELVCYLGMYHLVA